MKKAQSLIEYSLILVLISLIAISTLHFLGKRMSFGEDSYKIPDTKQNITETMTNYCEQKGMIYNPKIEDCEGISNKTAESQLGK